MLSQLTYGLTHIPEVIIPLFQSVGNWGYLCLFLITFMETGLVVFPWLPGESLIFVATSLSAVSTNKIHIEILLPGFFIAALLGDTVNYLIGTRLIKLPGSSNAWMALTWSERGSSFNATALNRSSSAASSP